MERNVILSIAKSDLPRNVKRRSARTVRGMVERFVARNITPNKLQKMFDGLKEQDKLDMLMQLLPYTVAKQTPDGVSGEELQKLHEMVKEAIHTHGAAI